MMTTTDFNDKHRLKYYTVKQCFKHRSYVIVEYGMFFYTCLVFIVMHNNDLLNSKKKINNTKNAVGNAVYN